MAGSERAPRGDRGKLETVRSVFAAFAQRDTEGALAFIHPLVRLWVVTGAVSRRGRPYVGHEGIRQYFEDVDRVWQVLELSPIEFEEVGELIVVLGEVKARGAAREVREPAVWTWKFREGLVIDCRVDSDLRAAREALGLATSVEELIGRYVAAFNERNADELVTLTDPGIVNYPLAIPGVSRNYAGHQGLRNWMRDVLVHDIGYTIVTHEVRQLEEQRWALLGELVIHEDHVSSFALLFSVVRGLIDEAREYLSEENLLRNLRRLP